ncbi:MAG TPA: vanadium-dependent haloperoxidase [Flavobacteriaceae bacterium]|nr:vanadium-dependent haloperoxidase [Flavobacteriaceae bacterium]MCB9213926.1 vanadium-dependent haloperoxidase [Alteromonas sp.]HPF11089.1 vanadium-dependent haloperoxidase [Flavobacteriaceae bacterium]HQU21243.1 vanadium-dependent haloperoxidase [Flavobacteriaceae bacterium]HQU65715.1 vanadium-dependent haloperoxidase [Flavobacteriaceae bacterium]
MKSSGKFLVVMMVFILASCQKDQPISISSVDYQNEVDKVTEIMVHDIFSPPVASRIYAYPNIAAYEIIAQNDPNYQSLSGQIKHLSPIPKNEDPNVNYALAALVAHMDVSKSVIFSEERMEAYRDSLYAVWSKQNPTEFEASKNFGMKVSEHIKKWMDGDSYKETRTMPKFTVITEDPSRWQPTPPAYMDGIEPHWNKIRPFVLDSSAQFKPVPPPAFSMEEDTPFYKELKEVYDTGKHITEIGDESEEVQIAKFWDCNPYVSVTRGHLMFATKKITPGAHWIGITEIACRQAQSDFNETVYAYTKTSIGIFDGFISCWDEKYRSNLIRPETLINQHIDENWKPILQTPPFPEYSSGHSVVSGASATVLTSIFGDNFKFLDDTEVPYGLPMRTFPSFIDASKEAAISRMYGGIHYRAAIENGLQQGFKVGALVNEKLQMKVQ